METIFIILGNLWDLCIELYYYFFKGGKDLWKKNIGYLKKFKDS